MNRNCAATAFHQNAPRRRAQPVLVMAGVICALCMTAAQAELQLTFKEGAPKDRFSIVNVGDCALGASVMEIDLAGSAAGLIFDTTGRGAGVDVFQPFEVVRGAAHLAETSRPLDGDTVVRLVLKELAPGDEIAFTIDVDDTLQRSDLGQIRVSGAEIEGASVRLSEGNKPMVQAAFTSSATAVLLAPDCQRHESAAP